MKNLNLIAYLLVIIGALNWGLVGLGWLAGGSGWNVVSMVLGTWPQLEAIVYVLVGASAVWMLVMKGKSSM
jgi:uncharacterized membrane protein YuzA (DUF378 family)